MSSGVITLPNGTATVTQIGSDVRYNTTYDGTNTDRSGYTVSLNSDGTIIALTAVSDGILTGIIYVYNFNGTSWVQRGSTITPPSLVNSVKINIAIVLISDSGNVLIVSSGRVSTANTSVIVYFWNGSNYILNTQYNEINYAIVGLTLSNDGNTFGYTNGSLYTGVTPISNNIFYKVYKYNGSTWVAVTTLFALAEIGYQLSGYDNKLLTTSGTSYAPQTQIALSGSGNVLAIGCPYLSYSGYTGTNPTTFYVKTYTYNSSTNSWNKITLGEFVLQSSYPLFGGALALNFDGTVLAIGIAQNVAVGDPNDAALKNAQIFKYNNGWYKIIEIPSLNNFNGGTSHIMGIDNVGKTIIIGYPQNGYKIFQLTIQNKCVPVYEYRVLPADQYSTPATGISINNVGNVFAVGSSNMGFGSINNTRVYKIIFPSIILFQQNVVSGNPTTTITYGGSLSLNIDTNNTETPIQYTSLNPSIATVDSNGLVQAVNYGTSRIRVSQSSTTNYASLVGNVVVTVQAPPPTLSIQNFNLIFQTPSFSILPNIITNNTDTPAPTYTYSVINSTVTNVANIVAGILTVVNVGTANIRITQSSTTNFAQISANTMITVSQLQSTLNYTIPSIINYNDLSFNLRANTNVNGATLLYSASNPLIANVTSSGNVIVGNAGTANINISFPGTNNYSAVNANIAITVNRLQANLNYPAISSITKNYKDLSFNLNANTTNTDNKQILYTTDNSIVANVNTTGNITIGNVGTANITLTRAATTNYNSVTANILITVNKIPSTLGYPNSSYSKNYLDATFPLNANTTNTDSTQILYTTDNAFVATVNTTGNVTVGNVGTANIVLMGSATANYNSVTANIFIQVNPLQANLNYTANSTLTKNYKDTLFSLNANTTNTDNTLILYSTDNTSVAIVDTVGNVTIGNAGTANIMLYGNATLNYNSVTANILITVNKIKANLNYPANSNLSKNYLDASFNLNANTTNTDNTEIIYSTNNSTVAIVDTMGNVTIGNAGTANIQIVGSATDNYLSTIANIVINVAKLTSTITVPSSFTTIYGNTIPFNLGATNTNPETSIVYTSIYPNVATVDSYGNVVAGNAGNTRIQLFQPETTNYLTVTANTYIQVDRATPEFTIDPSFTSNYQDLSFSILPNISTTNTDPFPIIAYTSNNPIVANVVDGIVTIGNAGNAQVTLVQSQTENFISVTSNTLFYVNKIQPTILVDSTFNKKYSDPPFNVNAFTTNTDTSDINYTSDNLIVAEVDGLYGNVTIKNVGTANISLMQPETENFLTVSATTSVNVVSINPTIIVAYPITKTYGDIGFNINAYSDNNETPIIYDSLTPSVASIDSTGNISILNAGNTMITLTQVKTDNFDPISANTILYVNRVQASIQVDSSFTRIYGNVEPFNLNAVNTNPETPIEYTSIDTFVATIDSYGTVIAGNAGNTRIQLFQPETSNYLTITANTYINVNREQSVLTFPSSYITTYNDASFSILPDIGTNNTDPYENRVITYLSDNQAVADIVDGTMILGNAGTANVVLTQPQTTNFTDISAITTITVNRFPANLSVPSTFTRTYQDASFSILSNIATNNTDPDANRVIIYLSENPIVANIVDGTVTIGNAGTTNVVLTQPQTTNFTDISAVTTITVNKFTANLMFPPSFTRVYKDASFSILSNIVTNNTDPYVSRIVTYESDNSVVADIVDGTMIIGNAGTANVVLSQPETTNYTDISAVTTITVNRFLTNLTFPSSFTRTYNDPSFSILSNIATNNTDPHTVSYLSDNSEVANIIDGTMIIGNAGISNIVLSQPETTNYTDISAITTITVNRFEANLTFPSTFTQTYNDPSFSILSNIATNNTDPYATRVVSYQSDNSVTANIIDGTLIVGNAGIANIVLSQPQTTNFTDISAITTITVNRFTADLTFPSTFTKVYNDASFSILSNIGTNNTDPYENRVVTYLSDNTVVADIIDGTMIIGNAGTATVVLTQPQTTNFTDISAATTITVNRFPANLSVPSTFTRTYQDASFSILSNIATNNTDPYTIIYRSENPIVANIVAGTVTIGNAGIANVVLTQPQTTNFTDISAVTTITVNKKNASLTFPSSFTQVYNDASFSILSNIVTNNTDPYTIVYQSDHSVVANIVDGTVIIGNAGIANIVLTQPETTNYTDISAVTAITVNRFLTNLTFPSSFTRNYNDASFSILSNITTNNTDPYANRIVSYQSDNSIVANIVDGTMIIGNAGTANIVLSQPQTTNYTDISAVTTVTVNRLTANLTFPPSFTRIYNDASFSILSNILTNNTDPYANRVVTYQSDNQIVANIVAGTMIIGNAGVANITLTQPATTNYTDITASTTVTVNRFQSVLTFPSTFTRIYKDASFSILSNIATNNTDPYESRVVTYLSDNTVVANIVAGTMIIGNAGTASITLTQPQTTNFTDISAATTITVNKLGATLGIPSTFTRVYKDASFSILPNIVTNNTDPYTVSYQSSNPIVANIVAGTVTIGNAGTASVILSQPATANYTDISAVTNITVNKLTANLTFPSSFTRVYKDASFSILSNIGTNNTDPYETRVVTYQSNNTAVANIIDGTMIIGNAGTATVVLTQPATTNYTDISAITTITVNRLSASLTVDPSFTRVYQSGSFNINPNISTSNTDSNRVLQYSTSNATVASVSNGIVTVGNAGNAVITIKQLQTPNYLEVTATTVVYVLPIPTNITVSPTFTTTYRNATFPINATTNNSETPIVYSSSNPIVANVVNGIVTIGNVGNTIVTMTQGNTLNYLYTSTTSVIYVNRKQPTITVDAVYNKLSRDVSFQLVATTDNNETPIQYTSLNPNIATVVPSGKVTIGNVGNTIMTLYQPETTNYLSISANTLVNITNNAFQKVGNLIQLQELVNSGGKTFYVKTNNDYTNIVVSIINK